MADVGMMLANLRRQQELSQESLAELIGVDRTYISLVETGRRTPSWRMLVRFAEILRVPAVDVLVAAGLLPDTAQQRQDIAAFVAAHPELADVFEFAREHPAIVPGLLQYAKFLVQQEVDRDDGSAAPE